MDRARMIKSEVQDSPLPEAPIASGTVGVSEGSVQSSNEPVGDPWAFLSSSCS